MIRRLGEHAVVVGAGIGGLSAAGALAGSFNRVTIVERDKLPESAASRAGTPQDRHPHGLLAGGLQALESIFPGIEEELARAGAVRVGIAGGVRWERPGVGILPARDFGRTVLCASRPLIEHRIRHRVMALGNVELWPGARVTDIAGGSSDGRVRMVRFAFGQGGAAALAADLVVDASGRGALMLAALDSLGWGRPEVTEIGVDIRYASAVIRIPDGAALGSRIVLTQPDPPRLAKNAVMLPAEGNRWMVLIADRGPGARPEDWPAFLDALRGLSTPTLYEALRHAEPPREICHYVFPASIWRHFERMPHLPRGVLPFGDSLCRFNPVYGQGMSAAAMQARLLRDQLEQTTGPDPLDAVQAGFMAAVASVLETPWNMAAVADFAFLDTRGERPEGFADGQRFEAALFRAAVADPVVHRVLIEVAQLLRPQSDLRDPDILRRVEVAA